MLDRYKYRVWLTQENRYADAEWFEQEGYYNATEFLGACLPYGELKKYIFEQCTGLLDEYAQPIYEGDIVKSSKTGRYYEVKMAAELGSSMFIGENDYDEISCFDATHVVGSARENKNLRNKLKMSYNKK